MASGPSKAMQGVAAYINKVACEVRGRLASGKVPAPEQLENYIRQVVSQLQLLIKGAPKKIQDEMALPWIGEYDFVANEALAPMTVHSFIGVMELLEDAFPMEKPPAPAPAPAPKGKGTGGKGPAVSARGPAVSAKGGGKAAVPATAAAVPVMSRNQQAAAKAKAAATTAAILSKSDSLFGKQPVRFGAANVTAFAGAGRALEQEEEDDPGAAEEPAARMRADARVFKPSQQAASKDAAPKARRIHGPELSPAMQSLPTYAKRDWIIAGIRHNTVTVISGDTGCGKSTLIPQLVCDAENLVAPDKVVVCTQPRRVAAITLAEYVSKDRGQDLGDEVGYQIRFVNQFSENTRLIYATTAIVLRRLHSEADLESIGCLIIDEVHERDVYTDFLLLLLKNAMLQGRMQHLKIVLMSATLNADAFAEYFSKINGESALKPVHIPGRMFDVEDWYWEDACEMVRWCPKEKGKGKGKGKKGKKGDGGADSAENLGRKIDEAFDRIKKDNTPKGRPGAERVHDYCENTLRACAMWREREVYLDLIEELIMHFHRHEPKGDGAIMVFLPGWGDISKLFLRLYEMAENFKVITLHSLMTPEQQHEAFEHAPEGMRKIVLSTNIAEASVTIDDVVYVIDSGVRKERNYDPKTGVSSLDTKMVTRANAKQRRGRAGRCQEGLVVHLFPSYMHDTFDQFPTPQMLTSSMEEVVLQAKVINGGSNAEIVSMIRNSMPGPEESAIEDGVRIVKSLSLLTREGDLTSLGRAVAAIPVQPSVAKFLLIAAAFRVIKPAACIAAFLSVKNPFQQTPGSEKNQDKSNIGKDYFNKGFASDHFTCLQAYVEWRREVKKGTDLEFCDKQGLSPETLDMAFMMVHQFVSFMVDAGYDGTDVGEGDYGEVSPVKKGSETDALVRAAMVAAFMPNVAVLYKGQQKPYWWLDSNAEVQPFMGSANAEYEMRGQDGDEWMVFSDAMQMGRANRIMDSSLVFSPFVLLWAKAVMVNEKKAEIRFDKWYAAIEPGPWVQELLDLRKKAMPQFKEAIEARDLSSFPAELSDRIAKWCCRTPIKLHKIEPVARSIDEEVTGAARRELSIFEWPKDEGGEDEEEDGQ